MALSNFILQLLYWKIKLENECDWELKETRPSMMGRIENSWKKCWIKINGKHEYVKYSRYMFVWPFMFILQSENLFTLKLNPYAGFR